MPQRYQQGSFSWTLTYCSSRLHLWTSRDVQDATAKGGRLSVCRFSASSAPALRVECFLHSQETKCHLLSPSSFPISISSFFSLCFTLCVLRMCSATQQYPQPHLSSFSETFPTLHPTKDKTLACFSSHLLHSCFELHSFTHSTTISKCIRISKVSWVPRGLNPKREGGHYHCQRDTGNNWFRHPLGWGLQFLLKCTVLPPELKTCVWLRACAMRLCCVLAVFKEAWRRKLLDHEKWPHWKQRENGDESIIRFIIGRPSRARSVAQLWGTWLIKTRAGRPLLFVSATGLWCHDSLCSQGLFAAL